ncbi:tRNA (adenosine(37)-N6)-threonylcarbamoyltransferase complex transferase subunit TsaD [Candidatus Woesearchaeota archaeon]|nr:tRNA (adenosine(37)-N6)-threonylcarbamoyltransferase complex transferase subunit TsaD [Candidatus Woesearchaeota archaeon]
MIILGVESTAHTFGIGIVTDKGKILANVKDSYTSKDVGMIPHEIADHHEKVAEKILKEALKAAKVNWEDIDFIAYSAGPGLDPALWKGYNIVKDWAEIHNKRLVGVNHCCAHLSIGKLWNKLNDPVYLYVSGVNTQVIIQEKGKQGKEKYHVMGETLDIGLGNMLDKFGRILELGFPAGPKIEELAKTGKYLELPYTVKGMDVSFSGLLTKVEQLFERKQATKENLCFSLQETAFAMCAEVAERALAHSSKKELLLVGGVGANKRFCEMLKLMCKERGAKFYQVPMDLAGDQGAMIAWEGFLRKDSHSGMGVNPHWRADEV